MSPTIDSERARSFEDRNLMKSPTTIAQETRLPMSPTFDEPYQNPMEAARQKPETYQPSQDQTNGPMSRSSSRAQVSALSNNDRNQGSAMSNVDRFDETPRQSLDQTTMAAPQVTALQKSAEMPQDSGMGSSPALTQQYDELQKELDKVKQKNAWYASELAIARKSGYQSRSSDTPVMDERSAEIFSDDDRPLVEALLKMRAELARVQ